MSVHAKDNLKVTKTKEDIIEPMFTNINVFHNDFDITNKGKALLTSSLSARNVDQVKISTYLQKYQNGEWATVKHWSIVEADSLAVLGDNWYVVSGYQYRMISYGYVYTNGKLLESGSYVSETKLY